MDNYILKRKLFNSKDTGNGVCIFKTININKIILN